MEPVSGQILKNIIKALDCSKDPIIITREDRILEAKCADGLEVCYEKDLSYQFPQFQNFLSLSTAASLNNTYYEEDEEKIVQEYIKENDTRYGECLLKEGNTQRIEYKSVLYCEINQRVDMLETLLKIHFVFHAKGKENIAKIDKID